jgi:hypothetical protein
VGENETGAEAWPEDAVQAEDVVTETEAGPLEESDIDAEGADDTTAETTDGDTEVDTEDETGGDSAEEKGK